MKSMGASLVLMHAGRGGLAGIPTRDTSVKAEFPRNAVFRLAVGWPGPLRALPYAKVGLAASAA